MAEYSNQKAEKKHHHSNPHHIRHCRRILVVKPSSLADKMHTFAAVKLLAQSYPKAVFDWVVNPDFADILDYCPEAIAKKVYFRRKDLGRLSTFLPELFSFLRDLREYRYDLVIDFQGLLRSALITKFSRHKHSVGFDSPREPAARRFYHRKVAIPPDCIHSVERNLALAAYYCSGSKVELSTTLPSNDSYRRRAMRKLEHRGIDPAKGIVAIFPGARWPSKTFPLSLFEEVVTKLHKKFPEVNFLIMGSIHENAQVSVLVKHAGRWCRNLAGTTGVGEMVEIMRMASLVISNDSGPLHIAAALNVPAIGFYGSTDPAKTGPYGGNVTIFQRDVPCKNCLKRTCADAPSLCFDLPTAKIVRKASTLLQEALSKPEESNSPTQ